MIFICSTCDKYFESAKQLTSHFEIESKRTIVCKWCHNGFENPKELFKHIDANDCKGIFKCFKCIKPCRFVSKSGLKRHDLNIHSKIYKSHALIVQSNPISKIIISPNTEGLVASKNLLSYHICTNCFRPFERAGDLTKHLRGCGNPPSLCPICDRSFETKIGMDVHITKMHKHPYLLLG